MEAFLAEHKVKDPDLKAKILPEITDIVYDYNMHIVVYEKEKDNYKKKQILSGIKELEARIDEIFKDVLKK